MRVYIEAAKREALEMMCSLFAKGVICTSYANTPEEMEQIEELYRKAKAALAAPSSERIEEEAKPLRNCDIFGWRDAWDVWRAEKHPKKPETYKEAYDSTAAFMDWFMSKAEQGGVTDGVQSAP